MNQGADLKCKHPVRLSVACLPPSPHYRSRLQFPSPSWIAGGGLWITGARIKSKKTSAINHFLVAFGFDEGEPMEIVRRTILTHSAYLTYSLQDTFLLRTVALALAVYNCNIDTAVVPSKKLPDHHDDAF